jgi:hypothetical protein
MNKSIEQLARLLPEGLDEKTVDSIVNLFFTILTEEVSNNMNSLTVKVKAFIRGQVESLKEQAVKELELENETFRNAQLFEAAKSFFVTELTSTDEDSTINAISEEKDEVIGKMGVITEELDKTLRENVKLRKLLKVVSDKNTKLTESLEVNMESLAESRATNSMKLSDTAEVVSKENFKRQGKLLEGKRSTQPRDDENQFLTGDVLSLMHD